MCQRKKENQQRSLGFVVLALLVLLQRWAHSSSDSLALQAGYQDTAGQSLTASV